MNNLAIIPARGGSKGIPGKNLRPVAGKPLVAWSIEAARASKGVHRVVVSTDDMGIAQIAKQYGAGVVMRPASLSGDDASSESALLHVLATLHESEQYQPDLVVFLQCTSPLTVSDDIDRCIQKLLDEEADTATTVTPFHYFVWNAPDGAAATGINHNPSIRQRRQDREPQFLETGAVYVMKAAGFLHHKHRFFGKTVLSVMPPERVLEIDEPDDLWMADLKMRKLLAAQNKDVIPAHIKGVVFDFDGVMTDNKVYTDQEGRESVRCDRGDGMGIEMLKQEGLLLAVLSTENNPVVTARCRKLGLECFQGLGSAKHEAFLAWCRSKGVNPLEVIYMGNDMNDVRCMELAGFSVVPSDAVTELQPFANLILAKKGGKGAVRELCDRILLSLKQQY